MDELRGKGERVLLVEDDDDARKALRQIIEELGYAATAAATAEEAGLLPQEPPFLLLLADVGLPGAQGTDLANGLKDRWPGLRVILFSGYLPGDPVRQEVDAAGIHVLQKPFDIASLAVKLRAALAGGP